jgi:hypothetical protein
MPFRHLHASGQGINRSLLTLDEIHRRTDDRLGLRRRPCNHLFRDGDIHDPRNITNFPTIALISFRSTMHSFKGGGVNVYHIYHIFARTVEEARLL